MTFEITVGSADDVQRMARWAADEGWNPGNTDSHAFFAADPGAFLIGRLDDEPVVCISVAKYGQAFGFLGFYIARPPVRGKGFGIQIWRAGMARLAGRNVGLDGVVAQQANYRKSGFRSAWNNVRHEGTPAGAPVPAGVSLLDARSVAFDKLAAYDRRFFPEARDSFLASWITLTRGGDGGLRDGSSPDAVMLLPAGGLGGGPSPIRPRSPPPWFPRSPPGSAPRRWRSTCRISTSPPWPWPRRWG
jgi:hypothetical protein